jgi:hypothetical protein
MYRNVLTSLYSSRRVHPFCRKRVVLIVVGWRLVRLESLERGSNGTQEYHEGDEGHGTSCILLWKVVLHLRVLAFNRFVSEIRLFL